jgi:integrating conjugative element protein (TIGR03752 family)
MGNKLLYGLVGGGVFLLVVLILATSGSGGKSARPGASRETDETEFSQAARDSHVNTMAALSAEIQGAKASNESLERANELLEKRNTQLEENLQLLTNNQSKLDEKIKRVERNPQFDKLADYEKLLAAQVEGISRKVESQRSPFEGLPSPSAGTTVQPVTPVDPSEPLFDRFHLRKPGSINEEQGGDYQWFMPTNRPQDEQSRNSGKVDLGNPGALALAPSTPVSNNESKIKKYTINPLAINFDGVALTALVGRIPVGGRTEDPYRAKILIGKESLAANHIFFENVAGMLVGGWAVGDWNLSCVDVKLDSYAFVFDDGTIVAKEAESGESIGYISMPNGFPCVPGTFHTNAPEFLTQRTVLSSISAAGEAYAASQTSQEDLPLGGTRTSVSGDTGKYVLGKTATAAVDESVQWLLERQQNSFDAVVAEPGQAVSVHFEKMIEIDYDPEGRKVDHEKEQLALQTGLD